MKVEMYGVTWCGDCRAARKFLDAHGIEYTEIDIDRDSAASAAKLGPVAT